MPVDRLTKSTLAEMRDADEGLVFVVERTAPEPAWWRTDLTPAQLRLIQDIANQAMDDPYPHVWDFLNLAAREDTDTAATRLAELVETGALDVTAIEPTHDVPHMRWQARTLDQRP